MDTERYVKCEHTEDNYQSFCEQSAVEWILYKRKLHSRCSQHRFNRLIQPIFTNLQDALAALAMERL